jgi:hypothetical protein
MKDKTSSVAPTSSNPILERILADCNQVSQERFAEPQPPRLTAKGMSRRRFLIQAAKGAIGTGLALGTLSHINNQSFAQVGEPPLGEDALQNLTPVVEVISEKAWDGDRLNAEIVSEMLDRAMVKVTGFGSAKEAWKEFVLPKDIVGIKINPLGGEKLCTHRLLVDMIIDGLYGAGVLRNQIVIWDRFEAHLINAGYEINQSDQGVRCFASDSEGVGYDDEVFYETEKDVEVRRENESTRSRYTQILTQEVSVIINVPVLKHHPITGVSGCLKNLAFGAVDNTFRFHSTPLNCDPAIGEIYAHPIIKDKVVLNIVDGLLPAFDKGPTYHPDGVWKYGGILASTDPVVLDLIALETINEKREEMELDEINRSRSAKYINSSWRLGLGTNNLDEVNYQQLKV